MKFLNIFLIVLLLSIPITFAIPDSLGLGFLYSIFPIFSYVDSIGNWTLDKSDYYNSSEVYNKTEIDTQGKVETIWSVSLATDTELAAQDECSEITNCVPSAWDSASDVGANVLNGTHILESNLSCQDITGGVGLCDGTDAVNDGIYDCTTVNACTIDAESMEGVDWGTMTDTKWCVYDSSSTEVDCNVEPVVNTDTQDLSYTAATDVISLVNGGSIDITEVDTDTTYSNTTPIHLSATTFSLQTCADNQVLKMEGAAWHCEADDAGAGAYTFNLTGDSGTMQTIDTTNIVDIEGGTNGIDTVVGATDKVTINLDWSEVGNDAIAEGKIAFSTACGAGNHYYLNGNDLACESDDDTTYTNTTPINLTGTTFSLEKCADNEIYKMNGASWNCEADAGGSSCSVVNSCPTIIYHNNVSWVTSNENDASHDECSEITNCVANAWDANADIAADEITEGKIAFSTACGAGNHYYLNGNDLACETDDVDDAIASCTNVNACTIDAESMEGVDFGTMTNTKWCVYDSAATEVDCNVEPVVNTDTQDLSYTAATDVISLVNGGSIDITEVDTDTHLTEDQVEAYILDSDNTANLDMNGYNITVDTIILENDQTNHKIYDNATCIFLKGDTSTIEIC